jgi:superfamily II DNA or RNA helicase
LILFDEGHRSVAESDAMLKARFPAARIVNFSATPKRWHACQLRHAGAIGGLGLI